MPGIDPEMTENPPAISLVMPCYDLGHYLDESLDSIFAQTMKDFEVIIVDDGSTDEFTRQRLSRLDHPRVRVIHQTNQGVGAARNAGIRQARGKYISCLDPDDRLRKEYFERAYTILEAQPEVGFVSSYFQLFGERSEIVQDDECAFPAMLAYNPIIGTAMFRREGWEQAGGYCETFSSSGIEDWDLWITLLELGYSGQVIPDVMLDYRQHPGQMSIKMYQPKIWGQMCWELYQRHLETYRRYLGEVVAIQNVRWAELRLWALEERRAIAWWEGQSENWKRTAEEWHAWIEELQKGRAWLEEEKGRWQQVAEEREQIIQQDRAWMRELENGKLWLEQQYSALKQVLEEREQIIPSQHKENKS